MKIDFLILKVGQSAFNHFIRAETSILSLFLIEKKFVIIKLFF